MLELRGYDKIDELIYNSTRTQVYRGVRQEDSRSVVMKKLRKEYPSFSELVQFRHQYVLSKNLELPGIVKPISLETYGNGYVLVMEDVGGVSLSEYLGDRSLNLDEFFSVGIALTKILAALYQNRVIHKDIKPANILINPETQEIFLIDFSIASLLPRESQELQNPKELEGTLAYISPEQTGRMNRGIDYRSDFYGLGVTFYELLTGQLPFLRDDPMELVHCHIAKKPTPPHAVKPEIPEMISAIVMKLMAKTAEERYQSATGIERDLTEARQQWQKSGKISHFELGRKDISDRFLIPEKLYGREAEVKTLLGAFDRVGAGAVETILVAGFSGIGKTAIVNEVRKPIVEKRGYFIKGKFDQFNRNIPLSAFIIAFRDLTTQLSVESDLQLERWKSKILNALGSSAQVIIDVIPELEEIVGKQPPVPELSGSAAQNRFNLLFPKFIRAIAGAGHPLVIFVDDLQWADSASLKLMELLMGDVNMGYLLLVGAYRDNEVFPAHPLMLTLDEIGKLGATLNTITLNPLSQTDINRLVADTLSCSLDIALPLTELVYQKTKGNPFFVTQFLKGLHEDGWIGFNADVGYWQCDMTGVRQLALTDDVVEFMTRRLHKLPEETPSLLKLAACIGNQFDLGTLAIVSEDSPEEAASYLWFALQEGLILPLSQIYKFYQQEDTNKDSNSQFPIPNSPFPKYKFLHDRVQQAAYSLIPEEQKEKTHYRIGQLLLQKIPPETRVDRVFEIINQLNYGTALITEQTERNELAKLNLIACGKARAATAYRSGREYASIGLSLLGDDAWQGQYETSLAFHELAAEFSSLCGDFETMERYVRIVIERTQSLLERVNIYQTRIQSNISQNKPTEAIAIALKFLQKLGVTFPEIPTEKDIQQAVAEIDKLIGKRKIEDLVNLPGMTNGEKIAIVRIVNSIMPAAYILGSPLYPLLIALSVKLSVEYGNTSASAYAYACYGASNSLSDVNAGVKFGRLALQVAAKLDAKIAKPKVLVITGFFIFHRKFHVKEVLSLLQESYTSGLEAGNHEFAGYGANGFCCYSFWCGQPLATLEQEVRTYSNGLMQLNQLTTANWCQIHWQCVLNLLGVAKHPSVLSGEAIIEAEFLPQRLRASDFFALYLFYLYKLMLCYLFGELESAESHAVETRRYLIAGAGSVSEPAFYFYDSLAALGALSSHSEETVVARPGKFSDSVPRPGKFSDSDVADAERQEVVADAERQEVVADAERQEVVADTERQEVVAGASRQEVVADTERQEVVAGASRQIFERVEQNQMQLQLHWADYAPMNHQHKVDLVKAEICRVKEQKTEALELYDLAIAGARENGYIQEEALANELAAKFYLDWGKEKVASGYMQEAYYCYARWGAKTKIKDLEKRYEQLLAPQLQKEKASVATGETISNMTAGTVTSTRAGTNILLDVASAFKASAAISGEIELLGLLWKLMQVVMENAGATKSVLLLPQEDTLVIEAMASYSSEEVLEVTSLGRSLPLDSNSELPQTIVNAVKRTRQALVINDLSKETRFARDVYLVRCKPQSILCLPLLDRGQLRGILYLENQLTTGAFSSDRLEILKLIAVQAAISLQNARLYQELESANQTLEQKVTDRTQELNDKNQDLTAALAKLKQTQGQLIQTEKMSSLGRMVAGVAHEINNPTGFIQGNINPARHYFEDLMELIEMYEAECPNPSRELLEKIEEIDLEYLADDLEKIFTSMKNGCDRIRSIVEGLRTFSRLDEAKMKFTDLHSNIDSAIMLLEHRLLNSELGSPIAVIKEYGNLPKVVCNVSQVNQVFFHILSNAIDAICSKGGYPAWNPPVLKIITETIDGKMVKIAISDNGEGMNEETQGKIFDPFFTTKPVGQGTGLGLSTSYQIIVRQGGNLSCSSELGKGTEFVIILPVAPEEVV